MLLKGFVLVFASFAVLGFAYSEPVLVKPRTPTQITRRTESNSKVGESEKKMDVIMERIQSLKTEFSEREKIRIRTGFRSDLQSDQSQSMSKTEPTKSPVTNTPNIDTVSNILSSLYQIHSPGAADGFLQNYLQALVCMLANGTSCGWQADLTAALSAQFSGSVMSFLSSVKSQTCPLNKVQRSADSQLNAQLITFQEMLSAAVASSLHLPNSTSNVWNSFVDLSLRPLISYVSGFVVDFLQSLLELFTVGLQIGIGTPTLESTQLCPQGDLKQLLLWGISHNLSWSFEDSILNMFLALESSPCSFTDPLGQSAQPIQSSRSGVSPVDNPTPQLSCDQHNVSLLNDTLCAEILSSRSQVPDTLYHVCKSLSTLSQAELIRVWGNACNTIKLGLSPLLEPCPPLPSESSQRVARSTLSLSQLFCNYENWTSEKAIDPALVTICSDNEPEAFLQGVCNNVPVMQALITTPSNSWVWEYCANASERYIVWQYCVYDSWVPQVLDPSIVALCWNNDQVRMETLLCQSLDFYMIVFSNPENGWLTPNCAELAPPEPADLTTLVLELCRYSEWYNIRTIKTDQISLCIQNDEPRFLSEVCSNSTFLEAIVVDQDNAWVEAYCSLSLNSPADLQTVSNTNPLPTSSITPPINPQSVSSTSLTNAQSTPSYTVPPLKTSTVQSGATTLYPSTTLSSSLLPVILLSISSSTLSPSKDQYVLPGVSSISPSLLTPSLSNLSLVNASPVNVSPAVSSTQSPTASLTVLKGSSTRTPSSGVLSPSVTLDTKLQSTVLQTVPSITSSPTTRPTVLPTVTLPPSVQPAASSAVPTVSDLCRYATWAALPVNPSVVGLCWKFDMTAFHLNVCCNTQLLERLTLDPQNHWLKSVCSDNDTSDLLPQVCLYSKWGKPAFVDMADLALCADLDAANFKQKVCTNATVMQNLLANLDNTWLLEQCTNLTESSKGSVTTFKPSEQCQYGRWAATLPDAATLVLCWDYDQTNFISSVCVNPGLLSHIVQEPSSLWVNALCVTYLNYTRMSQSNISSASSSSNTSTSEPQPCLLKEIVDQLNWSCSVDMGAVCQPDVSQLEAFLVFLRCGMEVLLPRMETMMITQLTSMTSEATSAWVVLLLLLEENGMTALTVTDHIRQSVLDSVSAFLERETNFERKRVLLQCFAKVLTSLMQTGRDVTSTNSFFIQEYFQIPLASLRAVLGSVDMNTMRQIIQFYSRNQASLKLTSEYLQTMAAVMFQIHLRRDETLFFDLGSVLRFATPGDISSLPPLQNNLIVLNTINSNIDTLSLEQRQAFGAWYGQSINASSVTAGGSSFIRDGGNLITYLPFRSFQHLTPAQVTAPSPGRDTRATLAPVEGSSLDKKLLNGLDVLLMDDLGALKQQFVAQSVTAAYRNLTAEEFKRLATLTCQVKLSDLQAYVGTSVFPVIQENIRMCVAQGISVPSNMISSMFLTQSELQSPASLSSQKVSELAPFLPLLGSDFLQQLGQSQLRPALGDLASVPFTLTQAAVIIDKLSSNLNLSDPGALSKLGSLISGLPVQALSSLSPDVLLPALIDFSLYTHPQAIAITTKLWGSSAVSTWLDKLEPLLLTTPLLCVMPQARLLLTNGTAPYTYTWNTQQAKTLFDEALTSAPSLTIQQFKSLGTVAQGVSCEVLTKLVKNYASVSSVRDILEVLRGQPVPLHPSLKKCLIEEMYRYDFFSELLGDMSAEIAVSIPMSTIKKFSVLMMDSLRNMIVVDPQSFLPIPRSKQTVLVNKIIQRLGMQTGPYTEEEFRSLGIMATFVLDEVFVQLDRSFFVDGLEYLRGFCYDRSKRGIVALMLQEPGTFGPVETWTPATLNQVDRFLFFLPKDVIQRIPPVLMSQESIERLFSSQQQWEEGRIGSLCEHEGSELFPNKQFVLQYFLGLLRPGRTAGLIPTCESLHVTQPAAWPVTSLTDMSSEAFRRCLELIGQDSYFSANQLLMLLRKTKDVYGVASSFSPSVIAQLGHIATQLTLNELAQLRLSDIRTVAPLGAVNSWTRKQLGVLFSTILNSTKLTASQLDSSFFVALGHVICGIEAPVIYSLNSVEFSKAVLWLGRLNLSCTEEQLRAMIALLSQNVAFGPISSWGPEVFIEIGAFAAGIPDMAMSALVKEQIEGITPLAISLITAEKFVVVFNQAQISLFSYEQAAAVTTAQRAALSPVQETALSMVLNPLEDKPVDFRGRSSGVKIFGSLCLVCSALTLHSTLLFQGRL